VLFFSPTTCRTASCYASNRLSASQRGDRHRSRADGLGVSSLCLRLLRKPRSAPVAFGSFAGQHWDDEPRTTFDRQRRACPTPGQFVRTHRWSRRSKLNEMIRLAQAVFSARAQSSRRGSVRSLLMTPGFRSTKPSPAWSRPVPFAHGTMPAACLGDDRPGSRRGRRSIRMIHATPSPVNLRPARPWIARQSCWSMLPALIFPPNFQQKSKVITWLTGPANSAPSFQNGAADCLLVADPLRRPTAIPPAGWPAEKCHRGLLACWVAWASVLACPWSS